MSDLDFAQLCAEIVSLPYVKRQQIVVTDTSDLYQLKGNILSVPQDAAYYLRFPPGHPREKTLYIGNPVSAIIYYPAAQFHRLTFEHKCSEIIRLLMALGVIDFKVECVEGWSNDFAAKMGLSTSNDLLHIETEGRIRRGSVSKILYEATFNNTQRPFLPEDLIWYRDEKNWQSVAEGRLKHNLKNFVLYVEYKNDFGVNASLKLKVNKLGLDLGGEFEDYRSTAWRIAGTFA